jgi:hypothetical protein
MLDGLGMPYVKIDVHYNNCMLFYGDNKNKINVTSVMPIDMKKTRTKLHAKFCVIFQ